MELQLYKDYGSCRNFSQNDQEGQELIQEDRTIDCSKFPKTPSGQKPSLPVTFSLAMIFCCLWRPSKGDYQVKDQGENKKGNTAQRGFETDGHEGDIENVVGQDVSPTRINRPIASSSNQQRKTSRNGGPIDNDCCSDSFGLTDDDHGEYDISTKHASCDPHQKEPLKGAVSINIENSLKLSSFVRNSDAEETAVLRELDFIGDTESADFNMFSLVHRKVTNASVNPCVELLFITALLVRVVTWAECYIMLFFSDWREGDFLSDVIDFLCFSFPLSSVLMILLYVRISTCSNRFNPWSNSILKIFDIRDMRERVVVLLQSAQECRPMRIQKSLPFFVLSFASAFVKIVRDVFVSPPICQIALHNILRIEVASCIITYGGFWYILYINRMALHCKLNDTIRWISQAAMRSELDQARRLINRVYFEYHVLRKFTGVWMAVMMFATTVHAACMVMITDIELSQLVNADSHSSDSASVALWTVTNEWLLIAMFYALPLRALGGFNIEYMWKRFQHAIAKSKVETHSTFIDRVLQHAKEIDTLGTPLLRWTAAFPVIGVLFPVLLKMKYGYASSWRYRYPYIQCSNDSYVPTTEAGY